MNRIDLERIVLLKGNHPSREDGVCAMEAVAWLAGETHSDAPACTCPVIAVAVRRLNDLIFDDQERTALLQPLLPRLIGTRDPRRAVARKRALVAADYAVRRIAPLAVELHDPELARRLWELGPVIGPASADAARREARAASAKLYDAADAAYGSRPVAAYLVPEAVVAATAAASHASRAAASYAAGAAYVDAVDAAAYAAASAAAAAAASYAAYAASYAAGAADDAARRAVYAEGVRMIEAMIEVCR
jgi:hypothetical protein